MLVIEAPLINAQDQQTGWMSAFLDIRDAIAAALLAHVDIGGDDVPVFTGRYRPIPAEQAKAVNVRLVRASANVSGIADGPNDWTTFLQIEFHARAEDDPEAAVDTMLAAGFLDGHPDRAG